MAKIINKKLETSLETKFLGFKLKSPIINASGCFGFGLSHVNYFDPNILGAITLKGLTLEQRKGNKGTRIADTYSGILNSVGLENPGIENFRKNYLNEITEKISTPIIANVNGKTIEDYEKLTQIFNEINEIDMLEINISCPNVKDGGMAFGTNHKILEKIVKSLKNISNKPLIFKLTPNVTDIGEIAYIAKESGADAISLINTVLGMAIDINTKKPILGNIFGGLSGPAIKPIALRAVYQVRQRVDIPIIGMGGITDTKDALEFFMAGANIVSVGTRLLTNPKFPIELTKGLKNYCEKNNLRNISEIVNIAQI